VLKFLLHTVICILLTIGTQVGGIIYLIALWAVKRSTHRRRLKRFGIFAGLYVLATFMLVPAIAPLFGRIRIEENKAVQAHSFLYKLANRNYVSPQLNKAIQDIATAFEADNPGIKLVYLDANFPFIDGFPLLPHLSHNDGKKVDVSLIYKDTNGQTTNRKRSVSGYGAFEGPTAREYDQTTVCKDRGYWQYDYPKYVTLGTINNQLTLSEKGTRELVTGIVKQPLVGKLFIEPHLKERLQLSHNKIRFHGCKAVRHDDHIHFRLR